MLVENIKKYRKKMGWSQQKLAEKTGSRLYAVNGTFNQRSKDSGSCRAGGAD